jgi:hypothetical protein
MKKIFLVTFTLVLLLTGCGSAMNSGQLQTENNASALQTAAASESSENDPIEFAARCILVGLAYDSSEPSPVITTVKSKAELEQYYNKHKFESDPSQRMSESFLSSDVNTRFLDATAKYTDEYFDENFLVLVCLGDMRTSSIIHTVDRIDETGNISIKKFHPEAHNQSWGEWNMIIELANEYSEKNFTVTLEEGELIDYRGKSVRTDGYVVNEQYPVVTTIKSKAELEQYYNQYKDAYDFSRRIPLSDYGTGGFLDETDKYTDEYFADQFLVIMIISADTNGYPKHGIAGIDIDGNIIVDRAVPQAEDGAGKWSHIIEIPNEYSEKDFKILYQ